LAVRLFVDDIAAVPAVGAIRHRLWGRVWPHRWTTGAGRYASVSSGLPSARSLLDSGRSAGGSHDRVVGRRARDLPVVALRISEIGVATDEELGVGRRLREPPARTANGLRQRIDFVGGVNGDDDVEPDGSATADPNPRTALARLALAVGGTGRRDA